MGWNETFCNMLMPQRDVVLKICLAGITHRDASYRIHRNEENPMYVLEYILSGRGHLHFGGDHYKLESGDVYFIQPHVAHEYYADREDPWEKIWFNLSGPLMDSLCDAYRLHGMVYFHDCPLKEEFLEGFQIIRKQGVDAQRKFELHIHRMLGMLYDWGVSHPGRKSPEGISLKEYLDRNWQKNVTLSELSALIHKSPAQTLRIFQRDWNTSPYAYLQEQRSFLARQYLENTNCPVKELAFQLGFKDEFYFSNWFKLKNKHSPTAYRNQFRKNG